MITDGVTYIERKRKLGTLMGLGCVDPRNRRNGNDLKLIMN